MNTSITDSNPTAHLMLIQNRAHHEDRLIHTKPTVDTRLKDFSHLLRPSIPSKKTYINKEKIKKINQDNVNLLSKIYKITFDKNNEPVSRYGTASKNSRREDGAHIELHPFSYDHRSRSLNNANRRRELEKINKDNSHLLTKLRTMKPTVPAVSECKQRKKKLDYLKQLIHKRDDEQPTRVLQPYLHQKGTGGSVFDQYIQRHDPIVRRNSMMTNQDAIYITNENHQSGVSIRTKNGRRMRKADSREGSFDDNRNNVSHALNSSEIVSRSVDPDLFDNNLASNYKSNPSKKILLPQVSNETRKKTVEDLDKKVNPIVSQDSFVPEEEIQDEVDARILRSIKEDDIKEEISHGGDSSHREKVEKNSRVLNRTNPPS